MVCYVVAVVSEIYVKPPPILYGLARSRFGACALPPVWYGLVLYGSDAAVVWVKPRTVILCIVDYRSAFALNMCF